MVHFSKLTLLEFTMYNPAPMGFSWSRSQEEIFSIFTLYRSIFVAYSIQIPSPWVLFSDCLQIFFSNIVFFIFTSVPFFIYTDFCNNNKNSIFFIILYLNQYNNMNYTTPVRIILEELNFVQFCFFVISNIQSSSYVGLTVYEFT